MIGERTLVLLATAALTIAGAAVLAAPAGAAAQTPVGAGYVVSPARVRSATMVLQVPTVVCGPKSTTSIDAGMFGTIDNGTLITRWNLAVVASCHDGVARYRAVDDGVPQIAVRPGDRIKLKKANAGSYEIDDLTSGAGVGGASMPGPGAPKPVLQAPVLFGAHITGTIKQATRISVRQSRVNRVELSQLDPTRQRQVGSGSGSTVAAAAGLRSPGAFGVTVGRR